MAESRLFSPYVKRELQARRLRVQALRCTPSSARGTIGRFTARIEGLGLGEPTLEFFQQRIREEEGMRTRIALPLVALAILMAASISPAFAQGGGGGGRPMMGPPLQLTSSGITDGGTIPDKYTCSPDGKTMT